MEEGVYTDMKMWSDIRRRVLIEGESKRSVQRDYSIHFNTLQKIIEHPEPPGYCRKKPKPQSKIAPYLDIIDEILSADKDAPKKQRHTAKRIWERLRDEHGFDGGYTIVKDAVRAWRKNSREVFMPLSHPPGEAQIDFGFGMIDWRGERVKAALFVMTLPYSDAFFVCAFPRECSEAFIEGHVRAFDFFGKVPHRISYDNSRIAVSRVLKGRERKVTDEFLRLQSHYLFKEHFCRVRRPNEKGKVEILVGFGRRNFLVPVPKVESFEQLNEQLSQRCFADLNRALRGKSGLKSELLADDLAAMIDLPKQRLEGRRIANTRVNSLSLVRFDCNDYSVPTDYAHHEVAIVGSVDEVRVIFENRVVARHQRCWEKEKVFFDPLHYLALLERKPGAFDYALPLEDWCLPDCFIILRRRLEAQLEGKGVREFIKILRLLESNTLDGLTAAVNKAVSIGANSCDAISCILQGQREQSYSYFSLDGRPHLQGVQIKTPDLAAYRLLTGVHSREESGQ
jgi:transposase